MYCPCLSHPPWLLPQPRAACHQPTTATHTTRPPVTTTVIRVTYSPGLRLNTCGEARSTQQWAAKACWLAFPPHRLASPHAAAAPRLPLQCVSYGRRTAALPGQESRAMEGCPQGSPIAVASGLTPACHRRHQRPCHRMSGGCRHLQTPRPARRPDHRPAKGHKSGVRGPWWHGAMAMTTKGP